MSKTFRYTKQVGRSYYSEQTDEEFCDEEDFEYSVSSDRIQSALADIISSTYFLNNPILKETKEIKNAVIKSVKEFIEDCDLEDALEYYFEDDLRDYFEEEAMED